MKSLKVKHVFFYGFFAMPLSFAGMPIYIYAPDFYTKHFGVSLSTLGFLLLFLRFFDAIQDPFIGKLVDRFRSYSLLIMVFSGLMLSISFYGLFNPSNFLTPTASFGLNVVLSTTAFSLASICLNSIGGIWGSSKSDKSLVTSIRESFGVLGLLVSVVLPAVLMQNFTEKQSFFYISILLFILVLLASLNFYLWNKNNHSILETKLEEERSKFSFLKIHKSIKNFYTVYALSMLGSSIPAVLVLFFIKDVLGADKYTGLFLLLYFLAGILGSVLWHKVSKKYNFYFAWSSSMILAVISFIWAIFLSKGDIVEYSLICIFSGIAFGADLVIPPAILGYYTKKFSIEDVSATYFAILAFLAKSSLAVGSFLALPSLEKLGYIPSSNNSDTALIYLSIFYAGIPCIIKLFALFYLKLIEKK